MLAFTTQVSEVALIGERVAGLEQGVRAGGASEKTERETELGRS